MGLKITLEFGLRTVDYLDVTLNLADGTFKPYRKPNDTPLYINTKSNHPPNVIKEIPKMINRRLNNISSSREVFEQAAPAYQAALKKSGYRQKLSNEPQQQRRQ